MIELIQTSKQPVTWRCANPECRGLNPYFEFGGDEPKCPKCTSGPPVVSKRALIHFLVRDLKGPIPGDQGFRYRIACDPRRPYIATKDNGEAGTGDLGAANCPGCLKVVGDKIKTQGIALSVK